MSSSLADFDDDFPTATATAGGGLDLAKLADGEYEFAVKSFVVKDTQSGPLVSMKCELLTECPHTGGVHEKTYWLTQKNEQTGLREKNERQMAELRKDLTTLGFDADNWTKQNSRPFSHEINRVPACIVGVIFKAKKKEGGKKPNAPGNYQNLYVNERVDDGKPLKFTAKEMDEANADPFG